MREGACSACEQGGEVAKQSRLSESMGKDNGLRACKSVKLTLEEKKTQSRL